MSANEFFLKRDCGSDVVTQTILSAISFWLADWTLADRIACAAMESATPIRQELRENDDDASGDVALLFAAIFGAVRLLN